MIYLNKLCIIIKEEIMTNPLAEKQPELEHPLNFAIIVRADSIYVRGKTIYQVGRRKRSVT